VVPRPSEGAHGVKRQRGWVTGSDLPPAGSGYCIAGQLLTKRGCPSDRPNPVMASSGYEPWGPVSPDNVHETGVSPGGRSGSPIDPPRPRRVERTRRETWSRARSDVLCRTGWPAIFGLGGELEQWMTDKSVGRSPCARRDDGRRPFVPYTTHASMPLFVANVLMSRAG
jgi:hypothetical protein